MQDQRSQTSRSSHDPLNEAFIASEDFAISTDSYRLSEISEIPNHAYFEIETPPLFAQSKDYPFKQEVRSEPTRLCNFSSKRTVKMPGRMTRRLKEVEEEREQDK